jgi:hypothetical protein
MQLKTLKKAATLHFLIVLRLSLLKVFERGSQSKKHLDIAIQALQKAITELDVLDHEE